MMVSAYAQAAAVLEPQVRLAKLNTEEAPLQINRFNSCSIPALILFRGGQDAAHQTGAMSRDSIVQWVRAQSQEVRIIS